MDRSVNTDRMFSSSVVTVRSDTAAENDICTVSFTSTKEVNSVVLVMAVKVAPLVKVAESISVWSTVVSISPIMDGAMTAATEVVDVLVTALLASINMEVEIELEDNKCNII